MSPILADLPNLKQQARQLRSALEQEGNFISHAEALELLARQLGFRNWNTLHAASGNRPLEPYWLGQTLSGTYLGQPFTGEVIAVRKLNGGKRYDVTFHFETPVDVVTFDSFSAYRQRVTCTLDEAGQSFATTSNGRPHMKVTGTH
ncbi:glyoxalase superfamily protein [Maricaulis sp. D1M11]|uniref:glyoxalase superfamily protein n=1 Tax=Maricaulis sp. D1M11 TaxID=3076117 RepID=UPI0039B5AEBA